MPLFWASDFEVMMFDVGLQLTKQKAIRENTVGVSKVVIFTANLVNIIVTPLF
jgi:hypothetical protein